MANTPKFLVDWLKQQLDETGAKGFVLGLSGGIDSAVLGVLCRQATDKTLAVIMPCESQQQDEDHARLIADRFQIDAVKVDLGPTYRTMLIALGISQDSRSRVARANIKARLRMVTLYAKANKLGYLVVGSDDKSENYLGYFTKYGDGASDVAPLANLLKTDVRMVAREMGVPEEIIKKPSSPGLWENQTAESEMGLQYDDVDKYLRAEAAEAGTKKNKVDDKVKYKAREKHQASQHKREMPRTPPDYC